MSLVVEYFRQLRVQTAAGWNRFWFTPADPATLCLIRILAGSMILYTHAVWSLDLQGFFGPRGKISSQFAHGFHGGPWAWTHFDWGWGWFQTPEGMWSAHALALVIMVLFTVGLWTRVTSVLTFLITVSYAHRAPVALFGLDQINAMLAMYLMVGPSGSAYSADRWLALRHGVDPPVESVAANLSVRLIQLHMCVIYLFAGFSKLQGESWWDGTAMWLSLANYEYQTLDLTWLGQWPLVINLLTHAVVLWEVTYCVLVWPRLTRPLVLALAVPVHMGIAVCMGMITFGLIMLVGNLAFVSPPLVRRAVSAASWRGRAGQGGSRAEAADAGERPTVQAARR